MVMKGLEQIAREAEQRFGLPPLSKFAESLDKFPDSKQLKLIKEVLEIAERVSKTAPELDKVVSVIREINSKQFKLIKEVLEIAERVSKTAPELDKVVSVIREINSMPIEKLEKLLKVLKRIEKIMKTAPQDLLDFLTSLKEE